MRRLAAILLVLLSSCTDEPAPRTEPPARPSPPASPSPEPPPTATIRLVVDEADPSLASYVEGIEFAAREVAARGELDLRLQRGPSVGGSLGLDPAAIIVVGDASDVSGSRTDIEAARIPVILVGGDLYTGRGLFRYAFQTSVPVAWQARVLATYFIEDRGYTGTKLLTSFEDNSVVGEAFNAAWAEEGGTLHSIGSVQSGASFDPVLEDLAGVDSVVFIGRTLDAAALSSKLASLPDAPQLALSPDALDASFSTQNRPRPGTVATYGYTWSGWADMLPRIHDFRESFAAAFDHYPASLEQEGYDALMAVADALVRTGGEGGDRLIQELETFREEIYSSVPVRLGPDDHVFAEQSHLGLFAIEDPVDAALPPGEASSLLPWRPILRTFTTDGEKANFLDRDKKIFFPFWHPKRPTPKYWRAEYGIISRPSDPLH